MAVWQASQSCARVAALGGGRSCSGVNEVTEGKADSCHNSKTPLVL